MLINFIDKNMNLRLDKLSTKDSALNEFLSENEVPPKLVYKYFEEEQLAEFAATAKEKAKEENRYLAKFVFLENVESKTPDVSNTRPGMAYKYLGEVNSINNQRHGLGF